MKLLLTSLASHTLNLIIPMLPDHPSKLKVAFIHTAADPYEEADKPWLKADREKLISLGFTITNYDLKDKTQSQLRDELSSYQIIFVSGGNSYYLLNEIKKSGFDKVIKELLKKDIIYVGASAGSVIVGPDLDHLKEVDHPEIVPDLKDYRSLNLIKPRLLPHFGREKYEVRYRKIIKEWNSEVLPLRDNQALIINGDTINIVTNKGSNAEDNQIK